MIGALIGIGILILVASVVSRIFERGGKGQQAATIELAIAAIVLLLVSSWIGELIVGVRSVFNLY